MVRLQTRKLEKEIRGLTIFIYCFVSMSVVLLFGCIGNNRESDSVRVAKHEIVVEKSSGLVEKLTIQDLTLRADNIVVGTVTDIRSQWDAEHRHIYTLVTISIENRIKGNLQREELTITVPGGKVEGIREWVSDTPHFEISERAVLFLRGYEANTFEVLGCFQGKYSIQNDIITEKQIPLTEFLSKITEIMRDHNIEVNSSLQITTKEVILQLEKPAETLPALEENYMSSNGWETIMYEDFEGSFPGTKWTLGGNPTWGKDDYKPYNGNYSGWCAKGGTAGVDPEFHNYPNNMNAWMVYGPFSLEDATYAELNFYYWIKSEMKQDGLYWLASINGRDFYGPGVSGNSGG